MQSPATESRNDDHTIELDADAGLTMLGTILGGLSHATRSLILTEWCTLYLDRVDGVTEPRRAQHTAVLSASWRLASIASKSLKTREAYVATVRNTIESYLSLDSHDQIDLSVIAAFQHAYNLPGPNGERLADACEAPLIIPDLLGLASAMFHVVDGDERDELFGQCAAVVHWNVARDHKAAARRS